MGNVDLTSVPSLFLTHYHSLNFCLPPNRQEECLQDPLPGTTFLQPKLVLNSLCALWICILPAHSVCLTIFFTQRTSKARASCERGLQQQSVTHQSLTRAPGTRSQFPSPWEGASCVRPTTHSSAQLFSRKDASLALGGNRKWMDLQRHWMLL